jgi:hypothetical protein
VAFIFFASHAHLDRDADLRWFIARLKKEVRAELGLPDAKTAGFFDETVIETADEWEKVLSTALRTARVCVALYSPSYVTSRFCGKEYKVFLDRLDAWRKRPGNANRRLRVLFNILWIRPAEPLPQVIQPFQYSIKDMPPEYESRGLRYLAKRPGKATFGRLVDELAVQIRDAVRESELPELPTLPPFDEIRSVFHDVAYGFRLAVLHADGAGWTPYPGGGTIRRLADTVSAELRVGWGDVSGEPDLIQAIKAAEGNREAVVVVGDGSSLAADARSRTLLEQLTRETMRNFVLLLVWPPEAGTAAQRAQEVEAILPGARSLLASASRHDLVGLDSFGALRDRIEQSFVQLRQSLVAADPAQRADDPGVRATAQEAGLSLDVRPSITGPGAGQ